MNDRHHARWGIALLAVAAGLLLLSAPCLLGGALGMVGVLADVSGPENQQMGRQLLRMSVYPLGAGLLVLAVGILVLRSRPK